MPLGLCTPHQNLLPTPSRISNSEYLVQNAAGTFISSNPDHDDGGQRAYQELQDSIERTPVQLPHQEQIQLWEKATANSASLTSEERLQVLERWPMDDFNQKREAICGKSFEDLMEKAAHSSKDLTRDEASVIIYGVEKRTLARDPGLERLRWPSDLRELRTNARKAVETSQDRLAIQHAREAQTTIIKEKAGARELLTSDDRKNIVWCNRSGWAKKLNEERPGQHWGFALYRTCFEDDRAWHHFQQELDRLTNIALTFVAGAEDIRTRWEIHYIEDKELEGASLEVLAADFRRRTSSSAEAGEAIPPYLRQDALLFADREAIKSALDPHPKTPVSNAPQRSWVYAVDATYTEASLKSYKHGFQGWVKVCLPNLLTTFFARLAPRGSNDDKPEETNKMMQSWDVVYYKSRYDSGKVYPPISLYNRGN